MAFTLYRKEKMDVEIDGTKVVVTYRPLTAMEALQFALKSERLKGTPDESSTEQYVRTANLFLDLFSEIILDIENVGDLPEGWNKTSVDLRKTLDMFGVNFLSELIAAYNNKSKVPEEEIPKS